MAIGRKKAKQGKSKRSKQKIPPKSTEEYEAEVAAANRELAQARSESEELWDARCKIEEAYSSRKEELEAVTQYLEYELKTIQNETETLNGQLEKQEEVRNEQKAKFEKDIAKLTQEMEAAKKEQDDKIYYETSTLTILGNFDRKREEYLRKDESLTLEEDSQQKRHKMEIYEIEKRNLLKMDKLRKESTAKVDLVRQHALTILHEKTGETNQFDVFEGQIIALSDKYTKLIDELDGIRQNEATAELQVEILSERLEMIQRDRTRKIEDGGQNVKKQESVKDEDPNTDVVSSESTTRDLQSKQEIEVDTESRAGLNRYLELFEELESMAFHAMSLQDRLKLSLESTTTLEKEARLEEIYDTIYIEREETIREMLCLIESNKPSVKGHQFGVAQTLRRTKHNPTRIKLQRHDLMRNWRMTTQNQLKKLHKEIGIKE